jgi:hypothetical protein
MSNLSQLATADKLDLLLADIKGDVKFIKLPTRKPKKAYLTADRVGGGGTRWQPSVRAGHANRHLKAGSPTH